MLAASRRAGVTLVEMLIAMAIIATLAAVLYPAVAVQLRRGQSTALASQFDALRKAIDAYHENVLRYPTVLTHLTVQPASGDVDLCGTAIPAANRNAWRGPYLTQNIVGNMPVGDATLLNDIRRNPPTTATGQVGLLLIDLIEVEQNSATDLEQQYDGNSNFLTGTVTWIPPGNLTFQIPIRGC